MTGPFSPPLPLAIICDLDGTLALHDRNPFDYSLVLTDRVCEPISELIQLYWEHGAVVLLVTGTPEASRLDTEAWLLSNYIGYSKLFMRKDRDERRDAFVKEEILRKEILPKYTVDFVLEDRGRVVEMWRRNGLLCLQVAEGNF